ncbi:MAG TPA: BREX protein BrxB domain-containing protein, partial [Fibrobacteria bacterium]|nr:BREX protein BrxB domain-containing protein [Fibrobacteria bacterium]
LTGLGSLFGFLHISEVLREVSSAIRGRLAVFFPGEYENHSYRFLDAREGWNYMAIPITMTSGMFDI